MRIEKAIKLLEETGLDCMYEEETQEALWMAIDALKEKEKLIHCKDLPCIKGMSDMKRGSIIQANENAKDWCGTVLIVDEVKEWGVQAFVHIPFGGDAYIRLSNEKFDDLHATAVLMPGGIEE